MGNLCTQCSQNERAKLSSGKPPTKNHKTKKYATSPFQQKYQSLEARIYSEIKQNLLLQQLKIQKLLSKTSQTLNQIEFSQKFRKLKNQLLDSLQVYFQKLEVDLKKIENQTQILSMNFNFHQNNSVKDAGKSQDSNLKDINGQFFPQMEELQQNINIQISKELCTIEQNIIEKEELVRLLLEQQNQFEKYLNEKDDSIDCQLRQLKQINSQIEEILQIQQSFIEAIQFNFDYEEAFVQNENKFYLLISSKCTSQSAYLQQIEENKISLENQYSLLGIVVANSPLKNNQEIETYCTILKIQSEIQKQLESLNISQLITLNEIKGHYLSLGDLKIKANLNQKHERIKVLFEKIENIENGVQQLKNNNIDYYKKVIECIQKKQYKIKKETEMLKDTTVYSKVGSLQNQFEILEQTISSSEIKLEDCPIQNLLQYIKQINEYNLELIQMEETIFSGELQNQYNYAYNKSQLIEYIINKAIFLLSDIENLCSQIMGVIKANYGLKLESSTQEEYNKLMLKLKSIIGDESKAFDKIKLEIIEISQLQNSIKIRSSFIPQIYSDQSKQQTQISNQDLDKLNHLEEQSKKLIQQLQCIKKQVRSLQQRFSNIFSELSLIQEQQIENSNSQLTSFNNEQLNLQMHSTNTSINNQKLEEFDTIDQYIQEFQKKQLQSILITKISSGFYRVGKKKVQFKVVNGRLLCKQGKAFVNFQSFYNGQNRKDSSGDKQLELQDQFFEDSNRQTAESALFDKTKNSLSCKTKMNQAFFGDLLQFMSSKENSREINQMQGTQDKFINTQTNSSSSSSQMDQRRDSEDNIIKELREYNAKFEEQNELSLRKKSNIDIQVEQLVKVD